MKLELITTFNMEKEPKYTTQIITIQLPVPPLSFSASKDKCTLEETKDKYIIRIEVPEMDKIIALRDSLNKYIDSVNKYTENE